MMRGMKYNQFQVFPRHRCSMRGEEGKQVSTEWDLGGGVALVLQGLCPQMLLGLWSPRVLVAQRGKRAQDQPVGETTEVLLEGQSSSDSQVFRGPETSMKLRRTPTPNPGAEGETSLKCRNNP